MVRRFTTGYESGLTTEVGSAYLLGGAISNVTSNPSPRSGARCLKCLPNDGSNNEAAMHQFDLGTGVATIAGRFAMYFGYQSDPAANFLELYDSSGAIQLSLQADGSNYTPKLYRNGYGGTLLATASKPLVPNDWNSIKFKATIGDTGSFELWANGTKIIDFSGDTQQTAQAAVRYIRIGMFRKGGTGVAGRYVGLDDVAINDTTGTNDNDTPVDAADLLLTPNGNGNYSQFVGSDGNQVDNFDLVDTIPAQITTYVESETVGDRDTYTMSDLPATIAAVRFVQPIVYAKLAAAGEGDIRTTVRSGTTDNDDAADSPVPSVAGFIWGDIRYTDPADASELTPAKVNGFEVGIKVT